MKSLRLIALVLALGLSVYGQGVVVTASKLKGSATAPSGTCKAQEVQLTTAGVVWVCASNTWTSSGGGGGVGSTGSGFIPYSDGSTFQSSPLSRASSAEVSLASGAKLTLNTTDGNLGLHVKGDPNTLLSIENLGTAGQPLTQSAYWREGVRSYTSNTGAVTYNPVRWGGWNVNAPGVPIQTAQPSVWYAWEGSYDPSEVSTYPPSAGNGFPWFEPHLLSYRQASGSEIRLISYTIRPGTTSPAPASANGHGHAAFRATNWTFANLENESVATLARGSFGVYGVQPTCTLSDSTGVDFTLQNAGGQASWSGEYNYTFTSASGGSAALYQSTFTAADSRYGPLVSMRSDGTTLGGTISAFSFRNRTTTTNALTALFFEASDQNVPSFLSSRLLDATNKYGEFSVWTKNADGLLERHKTNNNGLKILVGDLAVNDNTKGVILKSPDGTCYRFTVANGGALSAGASVTCP